MVKDLYRKIWELNYLLYESELLKSEDGVEMAYEAV